MSPPKILKVHSHLHFGLGVLRKSSLVCFCFAANKANSITQIYCSRQDANIVLAYLFIDAVRKTKCRRVCGLFPGHHMECMQLMRGLSYTSFLVLRSLEEQSSSPKWRSTPPQES